MQVTQTAILIMAAGASTRMGSPKQLLPWGSSSLLKNAIKQSTTIAPKDTYVVLGANFEAIKNHIKGCSVKIIHYPHWESGLGSTIAYAVKQLICLNRYNKVLITLADQPLVTSTHLQKLLNMSNVEDKTITASQFQKVLSVPAVFDQKHFKELGNLNTNYGAKKLFHKHPKALQLVSLTQRNILIDIDTPEDYANLRRNMH